MRESWKAWTPEQEDAEDEAAQSQNEDEHEGFWPPREDMFWLNLYAAVVLGRFCLPVAAPYQ